MGGIASAHVNQLCRMRSRKRRSAASIRRRASCSGFFEPVGNNPGERVIIHGVQRFQKSSRRLGIPLAWVGDTLQVGGGGEFRPVGTPTILVWICSYCFLSLIRLVFPLRTDIHGERYAPFALHCFSSEKPKAYGVLREFLRAAIAK
jgi:hypothetical protein